MYIAQASFRNVTAKSPLLTAQCSGMLFSLSENVRISSRL